MTVTATYFIHDNMCRPFKVIITGRRVYVHKNLYDEDSKYSTYSPEADFKFEGDVMIGNSPEIRMTRWSGAYGPQYDGNSILVLQDDGQAIWIGWVIMSFTPLSTITQFVSPVGNNDVPYPYAVDERNNYYIMLDHVIIPAESVTNEGDPSYDFYNMCDMSGFEGVTKFIGQNDWVPKWNRNVMMHMFQQEDEEGNVIGVNNTITAQKQDGSVTYMTRNDVQEFYDRYAIAHDIREFQNQNLICGRH